MAIGLIDEEVGELASRPRRLSVLIFFASAALFSCFQGIQGILLPAAVEHLDPVGKVPSLGLLNTLSASTTIVAMLTAGVVSDRTATRWGRRSPWLAACGAAAAGLMLALPMATTFQQLAATAAILWFMLNFYQTILLSVIPDRIPENLRGFVSAAFGLGVTAGIFIGFNAVAWLPNATASYYALAAFLVLATVVLLFGDREPPATHIKRDSNAMAASGEQKYFSAFRSRNFGLTFAARFILFLGYFMLISYLYYALQDYVGLGKLPENSVSRALSVVISVQTLAWLLVTPVIGYISDRVGRTPIIVGIASVLVTVVFLVPMVSPTWTGLLVFGGGLGLTFGVIFALDLKLVSLVLPSVECAGRDMGLMAVAASGPTVLAPLLAGLVIRYFNFPSLFMISAGLALLSGIVVLQVRTGRNGLG
jgi:MFS family permease